MLFHASYKLASIRLTKPLFLPFLKFLDYYRIIDLEDIYTEEYFNSNKDPEWLRDVELISETIYRVLKPKSVIDVGCGIGSYLYYLSRHGVEIEGIEGSYTAFKALMIPKNIVKRLDLRLIYSYKPKRRYDLAMCIEVLEHINPKHADKVLDFLCEVSDIVLISAARPGQGGKYHINEQPLEYWISRMEARGYELDLYVTSEIRKEIARKIKMIKWIHKNLLIFHQVYKSHNSLLRR